MEDFLEEEVSEKCGIFGIYGSENSAVHTWEGLHALQHRGQESVGIVTYDGEEIHKEKGLGTTLQVITPSKLENLKGHLAVGHVRYSTVGNSSFDNCQPFTKIHHGLPLVIAHNGNIPDWESNSGLEERLYSTDIDTEKIMHVIASSMGETLMDKVVNGLNNTPPAYALVLSYGNMLIGARDPCGYRPLSLGRNSHGAHILASESCAFDINEAEFVRDVKPGEVLFIDKDGLESRLLESRGRLMQCVFELVYFARPDSEVFGYDVTTIRKNLGRQLAIEHPIDADVVIPVPDAANNIALGYSMQSGIQFCFGLIRNHYIGRTFIEPTNELRKLGAKLKFNPVKSEVMGKRVVVVDDSIVRGNNARKVVSMVRAKGAKEVHMRIGFPPWLVHCQNGIDTKKDKELIAAMHNKEEIRKLLGVETLEYLSMDGLFMAIPGREKFCYRCTGN